MSEEGASYRDAGVDYDTLDAGKRSAIAQAMSTSGLLAAHGARALEGSRGEPAFAFELDGRTLAFVVEGLGTKSIVARQVLEELGVDRFADVAYDAVAAIVNDLACLGALPLVANAYFATGSSEWYAAPARAASLLEGWRRACADAGCAWGGGESPSLPGLLDEREIELAGAAVGAVPAGHAAILGEGLAPGDEIVLVASTGLHANGASLARLIAGRLPDGYATPLPSGRTFGEALLDHAPVYVPLVRALLEQDIPVTYVSHVTGHGFLKLMRRPEP
ncbi:MAG TPA: AIR synthase related protein, partial [Solirubrobacteraceae bacterium]|nr:AIR synthase related protein [Solirubrobacteraceae bacterium]